MSSFYYLSLSPPLGRIQHACTLPPSLNPAAYSNAVYIPATQQTVPRAQANVIEQQQRKGKVLQYFKNASVQVPKALAYARLAKGLNTPYRKRTFASQTQTASNPNTSCLQRAGYATYPFPNQIVGAPNNPSGPFQSNVHSPFGCPTTDVQDGGYLVGNVRANPCNQTILQIGAPSPTCFPTYCSDVPGDILDICYVPTLPI